VLTATEWVVLARLNAVVEQTNKHPWLAGSGATIATRIHKGVCQRCHREAAQVSALVTIDWAGRTLSREYLL
jgi:mono/diheme cytochrome c family protein